MGPKAIQDGSALLLIMRFPLVFGTTFLLTTGTVGAETCGPWSPDFRGSRPALNVPDHLEAPGLSHFPGLIVEVIPKLMLLPLRGVPLRLWLSFLMDRLNPGDKLNPCIWLLLVFFPAKNCNAGSCGALLPILLRVADLFPDACH
ncbi:MAG: hypothetical protein EBU49_12780 [Proteobacteria bacterium]|nr:hypothetical protein [Pseudomonadota bacterium]